MGNDDAIRALVAEADANRRWEAVRAFGDAGYTNVELVVWPPTLAALDALAPVIEMLNAD